MSYSIVEITHQGDCGGPEIRMYEGNGDNDGTFEERTNRCANACAVKKTPISGYSWTDFTAVGFIIAGNGRCYCEETASTDPGSGDQCNPASSSGSAHYQRFDFYSPPSNLAMTVSEGFRITLDIVTGSTIPEGYSVILMLGNSGHCGNFFVTLHNNGVRSSQPISRIFGRVSLSNEYFYN